MITPEKVYEVFGITDYGYNLLTGSDNPLVKSSPEMLVALINEVISLDCEDILKDIIIDLEISEEEKMMIKAIESADHKKRLWNELLKELKK